MDYITIAAGSAGILYGLYTLRLRTTNPEKFGKLAPMKRLFGNTAGGALHFVSYTMLPIGAGVWCVYAGAHGISLLDALRVGN